MYQLKRGVALVMTAEIENILNTFYPAFHAFGIPLVITSGVDGPHRSDSLHYKFRAIDLRKNFNNMELRDAWQANKHAILGYLNDSIKRKKYPIQIVEESDHIHVEWDEKT